MNSSLDGRFLGGLFGVENTRWLGVAVLALVLLVAITLAVDLHERAARRAASVRHNAVTRGLGVTRRPRSPAAWTLPLRALVLLLIGAALARPWWMRARASVSAVALFDISASIGEPELAREAAIARRLARAANGTPHHLTVAVFSERPTLLASADALAHVRGGDDVRTQIRTHIRTNVRASADATSDADTDVAAALSFAAGHVDPGHTRRILLVSDGRATHGDAPAIAAWLARQNVAIDVLPVVDAASDAASDAAAASASASNSPAPARTGAGARAEGPTPTGAPAADLAVAALLAPEELRSHAPFALRVRILGSHIAHARVTLTRTTIPSLPPDGAATTQLANTAARPPPAPRELGTQEIDLDRGQALATFTATLDDRQPAVFRARVARIDGRPDRHPENDQALIVLAAAPRARALLLATQPSDADTLARALRDGDIEAEVRAPGRAATRTELAAFDLIGLVDLPPAALPDSTVSALAQVVRDGAGLLVTAGPAALGPSDAGDTRLHALLPVHSEAPERHDEPALALALVIDRSGSMAGTKMDLTRQAARATAEALPPDDRIAVIAFDSQASVVVRLQRAANRLRIASDIGRIQPSGGTNILAGLREGIDQLTHVPARKKHLILLSDGQSPAEGIPELVDAASASRITLSTVAVGEGADQSLLRLIASRGGGRFHQTRDPTEIPRIFTRETAELRSSNLVERPTRVAARKPSQMLAGIAIDRIPPLAGYVRTRPRPGADLILTSSVGDPLLARWSVGLGQVVVWTSDLGPRWATTFARSPAFAKLWAQIVRATMRPRAANRIPVSATVDADRVVALTDAVAANDTPLIGLQAHTTIRSVDATGAWMAGPPRLIPMTETAPGHYVAHFAATPPLATESAATSPTAATTPTSSSGATPPPARPLPRADRPAALVIETTLSDQQSRPVAQGTASLSLPLAPELIPEVASEVLWAPSAPPPSPASASASNEQARVRPGPAVPRLLADLAALTGGRVLTDPEDLFRDAPPVPHRVPLQTPLLLAAAWLFIAEMTLRRLVAAAQHRSAQHRSTATPSPADTAHEAANRTDPARSR